MAFTSLQGGTVGRPYRNGLLECLVGTWRRRRETQRDDARVRHQGLAALKR
ncbi:MAG: hypothetical protein ACRERE_23705 [Candidatus Entotheonellia bacterium]